MKPILEIRTKKGKSGILYMAEAQNKPRGVVLFVHGFNSSPNIWGDETTGLVGRFSDLGFQCYAIGFSNTIQEQVKHLSDWELALAIHWIIENEKASLALVCHSMGGIITRYYLDTSLRHEQHNPNNLEQNNRLRAVAFLATPHHGVAHRRDKYQSATSLATQEESVFGFGKVAELLGLESYYQLVYDSKVVRSLNSNIQANLWSQPRIINVVAEKDLVVDLESATLEEEEVTHVRDFHQERFDCTHMRNPLEKPGNQLKELLARGYAGKVEHLVENYIPSAKYLTMPPIYSCEEVAAYLISLLTPLFPPENSS